MGQIGVCVGPLLDPRPYVWHPRSKALNGSRSLLLFFLFVNERITDYNFVLWARSFFFFWTSRGRGFSEYSSASGWGGAREERAGRSADVSATRNSRRMWKFDICQRWTVRERERAAAAGVTHRRREAVWKQTARFLMVWLKDAHSCPSVRWAADRRRQSWWTLS